MATSRRYTIGCTLGLILGGLACQALAEPPAPAASNDNGLMTFPNVRVVDAPIAASKEKPAANESATASGVRAYTDGNGNMSEATAADAAALSNAARPRTGIANARTGVAVNTTASQPLIYGPDNTIGFMLDEEFMVSQTVQRDATGKLTRQCVSGEDSAAHALHSAPALDHAQEESHNDR